MPFADTLGAEALASQYFMQRLASVRQAQKMTASMQFDLARSPLSDDELENVIDQFRDTPQARSGWGLAEGLNELISREPRSVPISDLKALQKNLVAQGYAPPDSEPTGTWDPSWYASFRRWDRDNFQKQLEGRHWYSAPIESGVRALTNTLPSRVFQGIVGATKGIIEQTPETAERLGLLGGAAAGAGIGTAIVPGAGTLIGAGIGAAGGFLMDLFGDDEGEEDQSGAERLVDALQPFNEYAEQGPKAFFEDLGFVLSAASMATGVGIAARGISTGVGALQAARAAGTTLAPRTALARGPLSAATIAAESRVPSLASTMFARPAAANQLGVFGTVLKAATRRAGFTPGSVGALESSMLKYSPIAFGQRYGPNIVLKGFGGLSQAQMGARLFGGIGQGSRGDLEAAREALEAELGRDLKEHEIRELEAKTAQTTIEKSIATAPELKTGVELPLIGDLVDVAAFVLYPQRLLPFRGAGLQRATTTSLNLPFRDLLNPTRIGEAAKRVHESESLVSAYAFAIQHQNPGMGIKAAVSQARAWVSPIRNAWLRADYGINREAYRRIGTAFRGNVERAFRRGALPNARADIIRTIRHEYDQSGKSELLERIMRYSLDTVEGRDGPTDFASWLVGLNGQQRGLDRLAAWEDANKLAKTTEKELNGIRLNDPNFMITSEGRLSRLNAPRPGGRVVREGPGTNLDEMVLVDRVRHNEELAKRFERIAKRSARDPFSSMAAAERARLARSEATTLQKQLDALRGAKTEKFTEKIVVTPARLDFADRAVLTAKRKEYLALRERVIGAVESGNQNAEVIARQEMSNFVDQLAADGHIADDVAAKAKTGTPSERIAKDLEMQAKAAAKPIPLPPDRAAEFERLGYKAVQAGDDVLFPDQLERMWEVTGIGDYTRRAQVWETLGLSPRWRSDRALFNLRREAEVTELNEVFVRAGIKLNGNQAMRRLHDHLASINHEGGQLGPFIKPKSGKIGLYKVDVRDLSPERILQAFEDVPGMTDEVAHEVFGALRRGAAYGGELRLMRPGETVRAMGKALRMNGLPGFSDLVRTWHADVPMRMSRGALRREEFNYKPVAELARSSQRARVEVHLKDVASKSSISEGQRQFGMMMLDSLAQSQVRQGRFGSVDEFFERVGAGYAERYVANVENGEALLRRVMDAPRTTARGAAKVDPLDRLMRQEFDRYMAHIQELDQDPSWYESSAAGFNRLFAGSEITLRDGHRYNMAEVVARIVAETSGGKYPADNLKAAFKAVKTFLDDKSLRHASIKAGSGQGYHQYGKNVYRKVDAILDGKFPATDKYGPFYHAVMGDLNNIVVDRRMAVLFGIHHPTLNDVEKAWIKEQVTELAQEATKRLGHKVYPAHVQERLWLRFNQIIDESERLARRRGDDTLADTLAGINRVNDDASADYGSLIAENAPLKKGSEEGFRDLTEDVFGEIDEVTGALRQRLFQQAQDDVLGMTQFGDDYGAVMTFFRNADFSTLVHENAHLLRRLMSDEDVALLERAYGLRDEGADLGGGIAEVISTRTKAFRDSAQAMLRRAHSEADGNGFTWDPHTGSFRETGVPGAGTAVATGEGTALLIRPGDKAFNDVDAFRAELRRFMNEKGDELKNDRMHVGGWKDDEGIHVDVSEILASRSEAQRLGALRQQKAVFDLETFDDVPATVWTREAEERFARDAEEFFLGKTRPQSAAMKTLKVAVGALWRQMRPAIQETNSVPREVRQLFDKTFEDVLRKLPERRGKAALSAVGSKQALAGAAGGAALGALEGDDPSDILRGVAMGTGVGLGGRALLRRTHGYLPDYLTRANTALRYTLSFTFDAGRYTEQNLIAMSKHNLPPMMAPTKYIRAREWRSPFSNGKVSGEAAWKDAVRFYDEINGTSWFMNIDDLDRRMFQAGMLGFSPRNWEVAQAWQLYQRGNMNAEQIRDAVAGIGRYGLGRTAAEKSANFVVFPFSFSKKLLTTLGDFFLQAPARSLLLHEGFRRYHESEFDDKVSDFLDRHVPILEELSRINNLAYGISPGRFFLQGLSDQRTGFGKAMQALASVFVPSGAATSLQQAIGSAGDLAIHAFSPIVLTGESITKMGGMDPITEIFRRYIPFIREIDQYFLSDDAAVRSQITALKEGAEPYYQFQAYQDELRESKAGYDGLAAVMGYSGVDGLLQSNMGLGIQAQLEATQNDLAEKYPTGFAMSQRFENSSAIDDRAILEIAEKAAQGRASESEERILTLIEDVERFETLKQFMSIDPSLINAMASKSIRAKATQWATDARFAELYDRFFTRTYGPIRRVA